MVICSSGQNVLNFLHIGGITLVKEEVDEIAGGASDMGVDRICEVGDRASEKQAAGGVWGRFYSRISDKVRGKGDGEQG